MDKLNCLKYWELKVLILRNLNKAYLRVISGLQTLCMLHRLSQLRVQNILCKDKVVAGDALLNVSVTIHKEVKRKI